MNPSVTIFTPDHKKIHRDSTGSTQDSSKATTPMARSPEGSGRRSSLQVTLPASDASHHHGTPSPSLLTPNSNPESTPVSDPLATPSSADKSLYGGSKLTRKESYKAQRKSYRQEKKRVADELLSSLKDPSVIVLADWLKVRGTLKSWTKLYCILKPGLLLLYKTPKIKSNHWVGTVLLNACQVIERPSKKDGFCFKLFHPMEQSIWAPKGPEKETIGAVVQPLPTSYLIFRAPSQAAGKCWLDALELSLRCSSLLVRSVSRQDPGDQDTTPHDSQWSEADFERHFVDYANGSEIIMNLLDTFSPRTPTADQKRQLAQWRYSPSPFGLFPPTYITPCPSPTPLFPGLYHAIAELEQAYSYPRDGTPSSINSELPDPTPEPPADSLLVPFDVPQEVKPLDLALAVPLDVALAVPLDSSVPLCLDLDAGGVDPASGAEQMSVSDTESDLSVHGEVDAPDTADQAEQEIPETAYVARAEGEIGTAGEQVEELAEEHKSLIWYLVKQVRPGMDLSKVVLPTFILEPRSFLDKLSDSYYHADILSKAVLEDDAFTRMKTVVQWYLSGFYKKPKGLKKPYNPVLGETFRCFWKHPTGSRTFYIAEQVSHHPPISAFFVTNRQDGFCISGSILAKSKFYGNSTSAILEGVAILNLLPRGEEYTITIPYALCKGILMGTLTMELGGKVAIECEKTGYKTELEFKLKPLIGGSDHINGISGKLRLGKETLATIEGYWDGVINIRDKRTGEEQVMWNPTPPVRASRLVRYTVPTQEQALFESERLWEKVSAAILADDQVKATEEKTVLEDQQREAVKERKKSGCEWMPRVFEQNAITGTWEYKHCDLRPWDPRNDLLQYENNYVICTRTRHQTPMIRTASIVSVDHPKMQPLLHADARSSLSVLKSSKRRITGGKRHDSVSSSQEAHSDSSQWEDTKAATASQFRRTARLQDVVRGVEQALQINSERLQKLQTSLEQMARAQRERDARQKPQGGISMLHAETFLVIAIISMVQLLLVWIFARQPAVNTPGSSEFKG